LNEESICETTIDLNDNLALRNIEIISSNENHDLIMKDEGYAISNKHYVTTKGESPSKPLNHLDPVWGQTSDNPLGIVLIIYLEYQESHEYA